jgi:hypothetical protein
MTNTAALPPGRRARVRELAEDPGTGIEKNVFVEEQLAPDVSTLSSVDVVVAIHSSAVSWVDVLMTSGQYQHIPTLPYTPGLEYAGTVAWKGPDVPDSKFKLGDKVSRNVVNHKPAVDSSDPRTWPEELVYGSRRTKGKKNPSKPKKKSRLNVI